MNRRTTAAFFDNEDHPEHVIKKTTLIGFQLICLAWVGGNALIWLFVEHWWPDFFSPFAWSKNGLNFFDQFNHLPEVGRAALLFWPVFAWGALLSVLTLFGIGPSSGTGTSDEGHLVLDTITSSLAGIWEELGYRCVFILGAMISLAFTNWFWCWFMVILCIVSILGGFGMMAKSKGNPIVFLLGVAFVVLMLFLTYWTWNLHEPVYWLYRNIFFPVLSFISFRQLDPIIYYESAPLLFIAAAMSTNIKFRDGHKYQGLFGMCNAWVIGYVLLYCMLYYGLLTAIVVHAAYDLEIAAIRYLGRKVDRLQRG
jgi:hypothetical protein